MTRQEWCDRADQMGYRLAEAQGSVDCRLPDSGQDWTYLLVVAVLFVAAGGCVLVGYWLTGRPRA